MLSLWFTTLDASLHTPLFRPVARPYQVPFLFHVLFKYLSFNRKNLIFSGLCTTRPHQVALLFYTLSRLHQATLFSTQASLNALLLWPKTPDAPPFWLTIRPYQVWFLLHFLFKYSLFNGKKLLRINLVTRSFSPCSIRRTASLYNLRRAPTRYSFPSIFIQIFIF